MRNTRLEVIMQNTQHANWIERFHGLNNLNAENRTALLEHSQIINAPKGTEIFGPGSEAENMLFLLDGTVRVQQESENGRQIVLYRIEAGQSCVLTTACLLAQDDYSAAGIAETDITAAALPRSIFDQLVAQSTTFRTLVFNAFSKRITDLFLTIEEVAFQRIDVRLAHALLEMAKGDETLSATHQQLSVELGTAREVISRQLQEFQRRGWIALSRGTISILKPLKLKDLSENN
jgi:CRP/FNR family transcriptional regulator